MSPLVAVPIPKAMISGKNMREVIAIWKTWQQQVAQAK